MRCLHLGRAETVTESLDSPLEKLVEALGVWHLCVLRNASFLTNTCYESREVSIFGALSNVFAAFLFE